MSYARYINSPFYAFPMDGPGPDWLLDVNCEHQFTYEQIMTEPDAAIDEILAKPITNPINMGYDWSREQLAAELRVIFEAYRHDVERNRNEAAVED